jgi:hypothetical protein
VRLVVIGLVAGVISGLFGIGGGIVIAPLLGLWFGYGQHAASATSLAAVGIVAVVGVVVYSIAGEVRPLEGAAVGIPATAGVVVGAAVQQRLASKTLSLALAALLVVIGVRMLAG